MDKVQEILNARGKTHGNFTTQAYITQTLKDICRDKVLTVSHREALEMILHKIGRLIAGDPDFRDHWDDIAGYAKLAADRCETKETK